MLDEGIRLLQMMVWPGASKMENVQKIRKLSHGMMAV